MNCTDIKKTRRAIWYNEEAPLNNYDIWLERTNDEFVLKVYDDDRWYAISTSGGYTPGVTPLIQWSQITDKPNFATINGLSIFSWGEAPSFWINEGDDEFTLQSDAFYSGGMKLGQILLLNNENIVSKIDITLKTSSTIYADRLSVPTTNAVHIALLDKQDLLPSGKPGQVLTYTNDGPQWMSENAENKIHYIDDLIVDFTPRQDAKPSSANSIVLLIDGHTYICNNIRELNINPCEIMTNGACIRLHTVNESSPHLQFFWNYWDIINMTSHTITSQVDEIQKMVLDTDSDYYIIIMGKGVFIYKVSVSYVHNNNALHLNDIFAWWGGPLSDDHWEETVLNSVGYYGGPTSWIYANIFNTTAEAKQYYDTNEPTDIDNLAYYYPDNENLRWLYLLIPDSYDFGVYVKGELGSTIMTSDRFSINDTTTINNDTYTLYVCNNLRQTIVTAFLLNR